MEVASQFNKTLVQRILPPLHQGLIDIASDNGGSWTADSHGTHWLGQRVRIYLSEYLAWHPATVDDYRCQGDGPWEYHLVCDSGWEGWLPLSIDVNVGANLALGGGTPLSLALHTVVPTALKTTSVRAVRYGSGSTARAERRRPRRWTSGALGKC